MNSWQALITNAESIIADLTNAVEGSELSSIAGSIIVTLTNLIHIVEGRRHALSSIAAKYLPGEMRDCRIRRSAIPGPPWTKIGRAVVYMLEDLDSWLDSFKESTA